MPHAFTYLLLDFNLLTVIYFFLPLSVLLYITTSKSFPFTSCLTSTSRSCYATLFINPVLRLFMLAYNSSWAISHQLSYAALFLTLPTFYLSMPHLNCMPLHPFYWLIFTTFLLHSLSIAYIYSKSSLYSTYAFLKPYHKSK